MSRTEPLRQNAEFLTGGGQMGALMRAMDWSETALGVVETWPQSLRTSVSICLSCAFPILIWWGPDLVMLYNDDYRPVLGQKHPRALGQPGRECWREIWDIIGPMLEAVLSKGEATRAEDLLLLLESNGYPEERYFSFSYSPIHDERGGVGGVFTPVKETTERVIGERRLRTLRDLAARMPEGRDADTVCRFGAEVLATNALDVPFAMLYRISLDGELARLVATAGIDSGAPASPIEIVLGAGDSEHSGTWPLGRVARTGEAECVNGLLDRFGDVPCGGWPIPPSSVMVLPIAVPGLEPPSALLVAAINPRKALDEDYRRFLDLVTGQIGSAMADALAREEEHKRAEALAEIDRAKTTFFSNVSHEFRTPLTLMLGPVEDLLTKAKGPGSAEDKALLKVVHRNGLRLLKLVNTLLDFSRIEAGRVEASYEPTELGALTAELAGNFRSACESAGLTLTVDCPPLDQPAYVDRDMWEKIVLNLVSNAFKYTLAGGIAVRLIADDGTVVLSVEDTGCGIPEHEIPRLFERFHRIEGVEARTHEGTGIGLALVQELVKLHGGSVHVHSAYRRGSRFTVSLPLGTAHLPQDRIRAKRMLAATTVGVTAYVEEALRWLPEGEAPGIPHEGLDLRVLADRPSLPSSEASRSHADRATVLVADDNADMRDYLRGLLSTRYEVRTVADGKAALAALRENRRPDLLVCDLMMPRLDGFGVVHGVRADPTLADLPVILLSARAGEESIIEALEAGADDYLVKPFGARELLARVAGNLEMARLRTQYRNAEESAHAAEERLRAALAASGTGTYRWNLHGNTAESDEALDRLFGFPGTGVARTVDDFIARVHPHDRVSVVGHVRKCAREGVDLEMEFRIVLSDGTVRWLYNRGKMFFDADGNPAHVAGACVDITERKRAEAALHELNDSLEHKVEQRTQALEAEMAERQRVQAALQQAQRLEIVGQLTGGVAHDFNNLLMIIGGNLELLRQRRADPAQIIARIEQAVARGEGLTRQLLSFSRRQALQPKVLDLSARTPKLLELLRPSLRGDIEMVAEVADDAWPVNADPGELELALLNIAVNARDAMPRGGRLTLNVRNEQLDGNPGGLFGEFVRIALTDTGTGIPTGLLRQIFEPFFTTKEADRGTGLGLAQVHGFATQAGGTAVVESAEGIGTTVSLFLPRSRAALLRPELETNSSTPCRMSGTILLAEDNDEVAEVTMGMLEGLGYTVSRVSSSQQAVEYLDSGKSADLVLTDIVMPGRSNGVDLARTVRERYPTLPVILTTGYSAVAREAAHEGFFILSKPYQIAALESSLRNALDRTPFPAQ